VSSEPAVKEEQKIAAEPKRGPADSASSQQIDLLTVNTIRTLSMDAVQKADSGHPGTPMALAPLGYVLWDRILRHNPKNPHWPNRDRFVLSNGHASMLLYSLLHLYGYGLTLDDLKSFRQWGSKTPGHPEYRLTEGVETTTGPLGQGVSNSVGMAIAERWLAAHFNKENQQIVDYRVYAICGDGDLMEGVSQEAASIAGHLGLSNLIWIYDNNHITIEGNTSLAFTEDVGTRFMGYHWNVQQVSDANNLEAIERAIRTAQKETERPTLIILDSHIAWGAPHKQDTAAAHGEPLGEDEIKLAKKAYGWPEDAKFLVPQEVYDHAAKGADRGKQWEDEWQGKLNAYRSANPDLAKEWDTMLAGKLPDGWDAEVPTFPADAKGIATRESSGKVLNSIAKRVPWMMGGAADLSPSTKTLISGAGNFERGEYSGRNFHFGIREHAMGAIINGMALSGLRPYGSTFLIFSDYMKPPIRLSALMEISPIFVYTHDSIGLGEDGPTHQPIEQMLSLRSVPRLIDFRPADANEVAVAWKTIMQLHDTPAAIALTRQAIPTFDRTKYASADGVAKGGYILADSDGDPEVILMGTGSEVQLCVGAYEELKKQGVRSRVVSIPSWKLFEQQPEEYRNSVLPPSVRARVSVEAGTDLGWREFVGMDGAIIGRSNFGASAPIKDLMKHFGFTIENVVAQAQAVLKKARASK